MSRASAHARRFLVGLAVGFFLVLGVRVADAGAYATPGVLSGERFAGVCPPRPAEYGGTDEGVAAQVFLAQAASDECVRREQLNRYYAVAEADEGVSARRAVLTDGWFVVGAVAGLLFFGFMLAKVLLP